MKRKCILALCLTVILSILAVPSASADTNPLASPQGVIPWTEATNETMHDEFAGGGAFNNLEYFDGKLYAYGSQGNEKAELWSYDNETWSDATPEGFDTTAQYSVSSAAIFNTGAMVIGTSATSGHSAEIWMYTTASGWIKDESFTIDMSSIDYIASESNILCVQGKDQDDNAEVACNQAGTWTELSLSGFTNPYFDSGHPSILIQDGSIYAIINYDSDDTRVSAMYKWTELGWSAYTYTLLDEGSSYWVSINTGEGGLGIITSLDSDTHVVHMYLVDLSTGELQQIGDDNFGASGAVTDVSRVVTFFGIPLALITRNGVGEIWEFVPSGEYAGWVQVSDNADFVVGGQPSETVTDLTISTDRVWVSTAFFGEGLTTPRVWYAQQGPGSEPTTTTTPNADVDHDGIATSIEHNAPNNGDGNGDGTLDENQSNVASFVNSTSGKYITVVSPNGTQLSDVSSAPESSQETQDPSYDYTFGLTHFTVSGVTPNARIEMKLYFSSSEDAQAFTARKLTGSAYSTLEGASMLNVTVGTSTPAVKLTYGIVDNGDLDTNNTSGVITDPVGLGSTPGTLPATGDGSTLPLTYLGIALVLTGGLLALGRKRLLLF
jgi:LPXTG-motif cell wall-anchored protein